MTWSIGTERAQNVGVLSTHVSASTKVNYLTIRINHRLLMLLFANQQERKIEGKVMGKKTDFDHWEETRLNIGMVLLACEQALLFG